MKAKLNYERSVPKSSKANLPFFRGDRVGKTQNQIPLLWFKLPLVWNDCRTNSVWDINTARVKTREEQKNTSTSANLFIYVRVCLCIHACKYMRIHQILLAFAVANAVMKILLSPHTPACWSIPVVLRLSSVFSMILSVLENEQDYYRVPWIPKSIE